MKFNPQHFALHYTRLLHEFACYKSQMADAYYAGCMSDHNAYSQALWARRANACDLLVDDVEYAISEFEWEAAKEKEAA